MYKIGQRKPSPHALRLFELNREGRILKGEFKEWCDLGSTLVDPDGNVTTQRQLRAYWIVMQLAHALAQEAGSERVAQYYGILTSA